MIMDVKNKMFQIIKLLISMIWIIDVLNIGTLGTTILDKTYPLNTGFWLLYVLVIGFDLTKEVYVNNNNDKKE